MAFSIKNDEVDRMARELAATTGEGLTDAVLVAVRERLARQHAHDRGAVGMRLRRLAAEAAALPVLDDREPDAILGYGDAGLAS